MTIARTLDWRLTIDPEEADARFRNAFDALELNPEGEPGHIRGSSKRSLRRNRWSAVVTADIRPYQGGSLVELRVEMPIGTKHYAVADDIAKELGEDAFDDRGLNAAKDRLSRISKVGGWREFTTVRHYFTPTETVLEIGQGTWDKHQGLVVLTDERLFFFHQELIYGAGLTEFPLASITSISASKKFGGEALEITVAGNVSTISRMMHGQGDALARAFRQARTPAPSPAPGPGPTVVQQTSEADEIAKLADLRDRGVLTEEEFAAKKTQILGL